MFSHSMSIAIIGACAFQASAGVTYTNQVRTIEALAGFPTTSSGVIAASDFGLFDRSIDVVGVNPPPDRDSYAFASQRSMLTPEAIVFTGDCHGTDAYGSGGAGSGYGESVLDVTFVYDGPESIWKLDVSAIAGFVSRRTVIFDRLAPVTQRLVIEIGSAPQAWSTSGAMTPGTYRLQIEVQGGHSGSGTGSGGGPYSAMLTIPSPATAGVLALAGLGAVRRRRV